MVYHYYIILLVLSQARHVYHLHLDFQFPNESNSLLLN